MQREITWENVDDIPASEIEAMDNLSAAKCFKAWDEKARRVYANEMVERVARAISKELVGDHPIDAHYECAVAALSAMREPHEGMLIAARAKRLGNESTADQWRAMVDAALEPVKDRADAA